MEQFKIGDMVEKLGSIKDYTTGRRGAIVEIKNERARVLWSQSPAYTEQDGNAIRTGGHWEMKPIRTWVNFKFLSFPSK